MDRNVRHLLEILLTTKGLWRTNSGRDTSREAESSRSVSLSKYYREEALENSFQWLPTYHETVSLRSRLYLIASAERIYRVREQTRKAAYVRVMPNAGTDVTFACLMSSISRRKTCMGTTDLELMRPMILLMMCRLEVSTL